MWRQSDYLSCAIFFLAFAVLWPHSVQAASDPPAVTAIRGSKLVLYKSFNGRDSEKRNVKEIPLPLLLGSEGEKNGRYQVLIGDQPYWIGKAQAKKTNFKTSEITAKCQTITKAYASSRGLGKC